MKHLKKFTSAFILLVMIFSGTIAYADNLDFERDIAPQKEDMQQVIAYLKKSPTATKLLDKFEKYKNILVRIPKKFVGDSFEPIEIQDNTLSGYIVWDPHQAIFFYGSNREKEYISSALLYIHEVNHAINYLEDTKNYTDRRAILNKDYDDNEEMQTIKVERTIARELGEPERVSHHGRIQYTDSVVDHS